MNHLKNVNIRQSPVQNHPKASHCSGIQSKVPTVASNTINMTPCCSSDHFVSLFPSFTELEQACPLDTYQVCPAYSCFAFFFLQLQIVIYLRESRTSLIAQLVKNPPAMQETQVQFLSREDPLKRDKLPTPGFTGFPGDSAGKESACNAGDMGSIPGWGRSLGQKE